MHWEWREASLLPMPKKKEQPQQMTRKQERQKPADEAEDRVRNRQHQAPCLEAEAVQERDAIHQTQTQTCRQLQLRTMMTRQRQRRTSSPDPQLHRPFSSSGGWLPQGACSYASSRTYPTREGDDSEGLLPLQLMVRPGMVAEQERQEPADEAEDRVQNRQHQAPCLEAEAVQELEHHQMIRMKTARRFLPQMAHTHSIKIPMHLELSQETLMMNRETRPNPRLVMEQTPTIRMALTMLPTTSHQALALMTNPNLHSTLLS